LYQQRAKREEEEDVVVDDDETNRKNKGITSHKCEFGHTTNVEMEEH
jgi:hypothetical protein